TLFLECWKRANHSLQYNWDVTQFEAEELPRPEFYGTRPRISPITMKPEIYFPENEKLKKVIISGIIIVVSFIRSLINRSDVTTGCEYNNCFTELTIQLAIVMIGQQTLGQISEIFIPFVKSHINKKKIKQKINELLVKYDNVNSGRKLQGVPQWIKDDDLDRPPQIQNNEFVEI
ncbi:9920_t:CDS:2, partial [Scutellospora calospora]